MAQETPTWLNQCLVEKILRKSEGDNSIQVTDVLSKPATLKGDNYQGEMIRVIAKFSRGSGVTEEKSMIFKMAPQTEGILQDLVAEGGVFEIEISMMSDTLKKMNELVGPKYRLAPKCLYTQTENSPFLVMEDLAVLNYRMADRLSGLDLDHCILAMRGLARFHASSIALYEKEPNQKKDIYLKGCYHEDFPPSIGNYFIVAAQAFADEIANWPEVKRYADKIAKTAKRIYQIGIDASKISEDEFNVINHGDYWTNNMMFKYDNNGKPTDHISVDFQQSVYGSPAVDILYFLNTSPSLDVIVNKRDVLLNEYIETLSATMKQLNCKTNSLTIEELKTVLRQKASFGMIASFTILPLVLCSKEEAKDFDEMMSGGTYTNPGLKSETFKTIMLKRIPLYDKWGLLDL